MPAERGSTETFKEAEGVFVVRDNLATFRPVKVGHRG